jgi:two-component system sensor histidine kinase PhoQ
MIKWLEGKYKSLRFRLFFAFLLIVSIIFCLVGWFLDTTFIKVKQDSLDQQFSSQSKIFSSCVGSSDSNDILRLIHCSEVQYLISQSNNLYLYSAEQDLTWQYEANSMHRHSVSVRNLKLARVRVEGAQQKIFKIKDYFFYGSVLKNGQILILSTDAKYITTEIAKNRSYLVSFLVLFALILLCGFAVILHRGLMPLDRMVSDLDDIATGHAQELKDTYASEFLAIRDSLNNLLNSERTQRERYRNTLADLAHSLKTPLAVLQGAENERLDFKEYMSIARDQIRRMDQIIQYQLTRAVKSIDDGAKTNAVLVTPIIERILSALAKVYREKEVKVILNLERQTEIKADERDLMEMLGNMLENAFKYCRSEVAISLYNDDNNVHIVLEDDGEGVSEELRNTILERGERADTSSTPGQGIGLSVSVDILSSYNCRLEVQSSFSLGGAKFSIAFPKE